MKRSDLAIDRNGDLLVLVTTDEEPFFTLTRSNSRGELPVVIEIADLPTVAGDGSCFKPSAICCHDGLVFLLDTDTNSFVAIDEGGHCVASHDNSAYSFFAEGKNEACQMKSSGTETVLGKVFTVLGRVAPWITKTSSSRNETDAAKTPYSRNGLWIGRYEN